MSRFQQVQLGQSSHTPHLSLAEVAPLVRREVQIDPDTLYTELGVRSFNKGTFHRRRVQGAEFNWQNLYRVRAGDLVFSNIMAWEGAVALAEAADDGCVGNHRMLTCECDKQRVVPAFIAEYFKTPEGLSKLVAASTGTVARNRTLSATALSKIEVPVPPLEHQRAIVARLDALAEKTREVEAHLDAVERDAERLLRAHIFCPPGETLSRRPMADLLTLRQADVHVDPLQRYHFAGVYSFGRGVFASVSKDGSEFAYERLSTIRTGDFIFPKLMAWEGALGVVPPECDGLVVSPEFPVFTVDTDAVLPEVLDIYFRTPEVWPQIAEISGGTNVRRRRVQPSAFLNYEMPVPSMRTQLKLRELCRHTQALKARHTAIRQANAALIPATLERIFHTGAADATAALS